MRIFKPILILLLIAPNVTMAADYRCDVKSKYDSEHIYSHEHIERSQFSVLIRDRGSTATISRCSFSHSAQKVTCDSYKVDKILSDQNVFIKKFYVFTSQYDVQVFKNLTFVENNGRGSIAYGKCILTAP